MRKVALILSIGLLSCLPKKNTNIVSPTDRFPVMGTFFEVQWLEGHRQNDLFLEMTKAMQTVDEKVSIYKNQSELSQINTNAGKPGCVPVNRDVTLDLLNESERFRKNAEGLFNIAIGSSVLLWKMNQPLHGETREIPSEKDVRDIFKKVQQTKISETDGCVSLHPKGAFLDMGGIAKGYALDWVDRISKGHGLNCVLFNLGRQIMISGSCSKPTRIGIQDPLHENEIIATLLLNQGSVSTSGAYERYFFNQGVKYGHIIDPRMGYPVQNKIASVTVWAPRAIDADVWSTALYVAGFDEGARLIRQNNADLGVIWVMDDGRVIFTAPNSKAVVLEN